MRSELLLVVGWAVANLGLALGLLAFDQPLRPLPVVLFTGASALVACYGLVAATAIRRGAGGVRLRQPRRGWSAAFAALGLAVALLGVAYGWWITPFAAYPLLLAVVTAGDRRVPRGTGPWPAALDGAEPAPGRRFVHDGTGLGRAAPVPEDHPGHGPPPMPAPAPRRAGLLRRAVARLVPGRRR
ncbi:hypothetical protein [Saccharopolyspora cebuensis]|uniref:Integral membrane protein n=1 Tax=Saccharopolyspora cebuensis TaxID=418759 RepID=A0ABV4CP93_9PSEU